MASKLDIRKIVNGAFLIPWRNRADFAIALANPVLLISALWLSWFYAEKIYPIPDWLNWGLYLLYSVLFITLAVTCHRLVLLKLSHVNSFTALHWSVRETQFLFWIAGIGLIKYGILVILNLLIAVTAFFEFEFNSDGWLNLPTTWYERIIMFPSEVVATYVVARLCVIFPATAVDKNMNLKQAWQLTQGNGWRLTIIVGALPWLLANFVGLLYQDSPSLIERIILTVVATALFVFEITAISLSYYELTKADAHS